MIERTAPLTVLKGIGEKTCVLFRKAGVNTVEELFHYYPRDYDVLEPPVLIKDITAGERAALKGTVTGVSAVKRIRQLQIINAYVCDEAGEQAECTWFNMPFLQHTLKKGMKFIFRGIYEEKHGRLAVEQPKIYVLNEYENLLHTMQPIYSLTAGLTNQAVSRAMKQILTEPDLCEEYMPQGIMQQYQLITLSKAITFIHFPKDTKQLRAARNRLVFDEFFLFILSLRRVREQNEKLPNLFRMAETGHTEQLLDSLPYQLTKAQLSCFQDIKSDMQGAHLMNRLVQGDVGSGKTIVAVLAMLMTAANGYQSAMMVPTEVLARQHFDSITALLQTDYPKIKIVLLTGSMSAREKRNAYEQIQTGAASFIIGTHALIQEKVVYRKLALVITDEQHRFGVKQRAMLSQKGDMPHILVMSATPIPRTLAIILYGDLDISVIDELPAERLPIKNCVVNTNYRPKAYSFIEQEVSAGRQAYIICPMVEESETIEAENVIEYAKMLQTVLNKNICVEYLHGKMKPADKNRIMQDFSENKIQVLVSTTVIEVGVNVPNATVMVVENAERFGLAQLHQLRGRVGRGSWQSYCIFMSASKNRDTVKRLEILNHSNNGFVIAEEDLMLRGPGDLFGIRQCGILDFKIADIFNDASILRLAGEACTKLCQHENWMQLPEYAQLADKLKRYTDSQQLQI